MLNGGALRLGFYAQQNALRHPHGKRYLASAVNLAYDKYGGERREEREACPLVILHGLFGQKLNWRSLAKRFQRLLGNTVFTLDLRNHGSSPWASTMSYAEMAEDVRNFLETNLPAELDGQRWPVHLLGHSMGGKTAMHLAQLPGIEQLIASLIIEDVAPKKYLPRDTNRNFPRIIELMKQADLSGSRREIAEQLQIAFSNDATTLKFLLLNLAPIDRGGKKWQWKLNLPVIGQELNELCGEGIEQGRGAVQLPCLFIMGGKSNHVTIADQASILESFPQACFETIPDAGHWVHAEKPEEFLNKVVTFIKSLAVD